MLNSLKKKKFIWNPVKKREVIQSTIFKNYVESIEEKNI